MFPVYTSERLVKEVFSYTLNDVNLRFGQQIDEFVYDQEVFVQSFLILLSVPKKSRWFRPEYGIYRLNALLFEPFDEITADQIKSAIDGINDMTSNGYLGVTVQDIVIAMDEPTSTYVVEAVLNILPLGTQREIRFGLKKSE